MVKTWSNQLTTCSSLAMRVSLVLLVQILMPSSVQCRLFSIATLSSERSAAFVPTLLPASLPSCRPTEALSNSRAVGKVGKVGKVGTHLPAVDYLLHDVGHYSNILLSAADDAIASPTGASELPDNPRVEQLSPTTTIAVFVAGVVPFVWATYEFWRRIAVGASFGTGSDSVVIPSPFGGDGDDDGAIAIGEDGDPRGSRGRKTLDRGALGVAYVLFAAAGGSVALALASVLMSPAPPM